MRVPPELLDYKQWILWRLVEVNGRVTKMPISPWNGRVASCDTPRTWSTYRHARYAQQRYRCDGIGFVFGKVDPFCGIDLDHCRSSDGTITPAALELIHRFDSYTEVSPSGTGIHILIKGSLPGKGRRSGDIEMYDSNRYFTVTGNCMFGTPFAVQERQSVLNEVCSELFKEAIPKPVKAFCDAERISDDELIQTACNARNGERFRRLWAGDTSDYGNDHSRADLALCGDLLFWCGGDIERVDLLFRRSGLMRNKWDRRTGDSFYGALTIRTAQGKGVRLSRKNSI